MKRIYFIRPVGQLGPIKIGCSSTPEGRLVTYLPWSPVTLELIASVPGSFDAERHLHGLFAKDRLHHEWFGASKELLALIARVQETGELPELPRVIRFPVRPKGGAHVVDRAEHFEGMYRGGKTLQEIGDEFGLSRERVRQILRARGVPSLGTREEHRHRKRKETTALDREIGARYLAGETLKDLRVAYPAAKIEMSLQRAGAWGAKRPATQARRDAKAIDIAAAYRRGDAVADIASRFGVSHKETVYHYLQLAGEPVRCKRKAASA